MMRVAASLVCSGFEGVRIGDGLAQFLDAVPLAGVVLFDRNIEGFEQLRELTADIRAHLRHSIIAIDQEGGRVMRLRDQVAPIPAMRELGASGDAEIVRKTGARAGSDLRRAGINLDFAPVIDIERYAENSVIGDRAFGPDPEVVASLGRAFAEGLESEGIVATFKHFPGHGATRGDSHAELPVSELDEQTLRAHDLLPFARNLPSARAVMSAHIVVPSIDTAPATLSHRWLTEILRGELGFRGVCFSDCLQMDAIARGVGTAEGAVRAITAGADCVLISHSLQAARACVEAIEAAVSSGRLSEQRLNEAAGRVDALRAPFS